MSDTTTTTDTSAIDEKKAENEGTASNNTPNYFKFFQNINSIIIFIILYFISGIFVLYSCKIAQSNILPIESDCFPFSNAKPTVTPINTNIFKTYADPNIPKSIKLSFPYQENSEFTLLKMIREYKNTYDSNNIINYLISIVETIVAFDYKIINTYFNTLNGIPETLLVLFGPLILGIIWFILFFCNTVYGFFLWFYNMYWFFKKNTNTKRGEPPKWEDITLSQPFDYGLGIFLVFAFFIVFLFSALPLIGSSASISFFALIMMMTYTGMMANKPAGFLCVLEEAAKVYKISLMVIFSIFVVSSAFTYLGIANGIVFLIGVICIYFGLINIDIFKPITETNLTPFTVAKELQAKRTVCRMLEPEEKHGLMYQMVFGNQRGGKLINDLKKISKTNK